MIAVIADDLSGATELAGVAAAAGFTAEVQTAPDSSSGADVIAFDTDTRRLSAAEAAHRTAEITRWILNRRPEWIYKKTDSVLRGHVAVEIEALLEVTGCRRVIYIPANPSRERVIQEGRYFIADRPLDQTAFAQDPEFPRKTSEVAALLADRVHPGRWQVPDVANADDLNRWAEAADNLTLCAGAVDFFAALLLRRHGQHAPIAVEFAPSTSPGRTGRSLLVCGSAAAWNLGRADQCRRHGVPVRPMPAVLFQSQAPWQAIEPWVDDVVRAFENNCMVMMAIGSSPCAEADAESSLLTHRLALAVSAVMERTNLFRVLLEGGATASAVLGWEGWTRLTVGASIASGIARLFPHGRTHPELLIKPGSYDWPEALWLNVGF